MKRGKFIKATAVRFNRNGTVTVKTNQKVKGAVPVGSGRRNPGGLYKFVKSFKTVAEAARASIKLQDKGYNVTYLGTPGHASRVKPVHLEWNQYDTKQALVGARRKK